MSTTPPPRTQPAEVRRGQLLDAAEQVLLDRGLQATTVADVARAAGVAKGTMYLHFESKAELLAALRARYVERLMTAALGDDSDIGLDDVVQRLVAGLFDFSVANGRLHHLLFHEAGFSEGDAFAGAHERLTAHIANAATRGQVQVNDAAAAAVFILHGLHGLLVAGLGERRPSRRRFVAVAGDLCSRTLGI
jgi:AcrR family transcriptional regulator